MAGKFLNQKFWEKVTVNSKLFTFLGSQNFLSEVFRITFGLCIVSVAVVHVFIIAELSPTESHSEMLYQVYPRTEH